MKSCFVSFFGLLTLFLGSWSVTAAQPRPAMGRLQSPVGTLLVRAEAGKPWELPALHAGIAAGNQLLALPGATATIDIKEGDVRLALLGNLPALSPTPLLECAGLLHQTAGLDLDFTLDRGRILVENRKERGTVKARIRFKQSELPLELLEPGTTVALELYRRWPAHARLEGAGKTEPQPLVDALFFVLKGKVEAQFQDDKKTLQGPVLYRWTTLGGLQGPLALKQLPPWAKPGAKQPAQAQLAAVEVLRRRLAEQPLAAALAETQKAADPVQRSIAVYSAGAIDDLATVLAGLNDAKAGTVRTAAVFQLRHYLGRGVPQFQAMKEALQRQYPKGQTQTILHLLQGLTENELVQPETYETLISYLQHDQLAVRELAADQLYRLVPQAQSRIAYDAAAPAAQRVAAQTAWRKLIPEGQVPRK